MLVLVNLIVCLKMIDVVLGMPTGESSAAVPYSFPLVTREEWLARAATGKTVLPTPVPYVVVHHSYIPGACYDREKCSQAMRSMQNYHMDDRDWWDIGYNFCVGAEGAAYEGRGWEAEGAHALHFNTVSIGICLIGDWRTELPPAEQLRTAKALIAAGIELGYISPDYKLVGHLQVGATECPGDALYDDIKSWAHYSESVQDLRELPRRIANSTSAE